MRCLCFAVSVLFLFVADAVVEYDSPVSILQEVLHHAAAVHGQCLCVMFSLPAFLPQEVADVVLCCVDGSAVCRCGGLCFEEVVDEFHGPRVVVVVVVSPAFFGVCVVRFLCQAEDGFAVRHEDGGAAQRLVVCWVVPFVECLQEEDACGVEVGVFPGECLQVADCIVVDGIGSSDIVSDVSLHGFLSGCLTSLPLLR